ncbi:MAG: hypothetical protein NZM38_02760 [Cytophagales bacterium]|nr:hypothetical protein [Cytophagales bacterium]MDW8383675.1 hypothetical protein [Flammeovirgaceae bacterium]
MKKFISYLFQNSFQADFVLIFSFIKKFFLGFSCFFLITSCKKNDQYNDTQFPLGSLRVDTSNVISYLNKIIEEKSDVEALAALGILEAKRANWIQAQKLLQESIRLGNQKDVTRSWLVKTLVQLQKYTEAQKAAEPLLQKGYYDTEFIIQLAQAYYHTQNYAKAFEILKLPQNIYKQRLDAQNLVATIQISLKDTLAAWQTLQSILEKDSSYSPALSNAFQLSVLQKDYKKAFDYASRYLQHTSEPDTSFSFVFALMWQRFKKLDTAAVWYQKALENGKVSVEANLFLAEYFAQRYNYSKASHYWKNALKINKNLPYVYQRLGYSYEYYLGNLSEAEKYYILARSYTPYDTAIDRAIRRINYKLRIKPLKEEIKK